MLFNYNVYIVDLHSITSGIVVNQDWSKKENIKNANTKIVKEIMVRETFNPNFYREIVTGILIPVYRKIRKEGFPYLDVNICYRIPKKPVFIKINEIYYSGEYGNNLSSANAKQVEQYISEHINNIEAFRNELISIFLEAENYYEKASLENNYSDNKKVKKLLKSLNKK